MGCCNESSAEQYAAGQMKRWTEAIAEAVRKQLLAYGPGGICSDHVALTGHLAGNLVYDLRHEFERAYNAGWRQGYKEARWASVRLASGGMRRCRR